MTSTAGELQELCVSFWHVALENFPEGDIRHRKLSGEEAVVLIHRAQAAGKLHPVTQTDLGAPYHERERGKTQDLLDTLGTHHGISISLRDFFETHEEEGMHFIRALSLFDIRPNRPLLVVTCCYSLDKKPGSGERKFSVAPDTLQFHLFEQIEP